MATSFYWRKRYYFKRQYKVKILVLNYEFPPIGGGGSIAAEKLTKALNQQGHETVVITMGAPGLPKKELQGDITIIRTNNHKKMLGRTTVGEAFVYMCKGLYEGIKARSWFKYEVIHAHFVLPTGPIAYVLSKIYKIPYILTARGSDIPKHSINKVVFLHKFTPPLIRLLINNSFQTICISESLKEEVETHVGKSNKLGVIRNYYSSVIPNKKITKEKKIFSMARLSNQKGIDIAIKAIKKLTPEQLKGWTYDIYGEGKFEERLKEMAQGTNHRINFNGWIPYKSKEYYQIYEKGAILLVPSYVESFGMTPLEGMFNKCAIIASDIPALKENLGNTALFIEPGNTKELSDKINFLVQNPKERERLAEKSYKRAIRLFAGETSIRKYEKLFREATTKK